MVSMGLCYSIIFFFLLLSFKRQKDGGAEKDTAELGTGNHRKETVSLSCSLAVILLLTVSEGVRPISVR